MTSRRTLYAGRPREAPGPVLKTVGAERRGERYLRPAPSRAGRL